MQAHTTVGRGSPLLVVNFPETFKLDQTEGAAPRFQIRPEVSGALKPQRGAEHDVTEVAFKASRGRRSNELECDPCSERPTRGSVDRPLPFIYQRTQQGRERP